MKYILTAILLFSGLSPTSAVDEVQDPVIPFLNELISELERDDFFEPMPQDEEASDSSFLEWLGQALAAIEEEMGRGCY